MTRPFAYLLTPGPITTSRTVKEAMLDDWGSWDEDFNHVTREICDTLIVMDVQMPQSHNPRNPPRINRELNP